METTLGHAATSFTIHIMVLDYLSMLLRQDGTHCVQYLNVSGQQDPQVPPKVMVARFIVHFRSRSASQIRCPFQ